MIPVVLPSDTAVCQGFLVHLVLTPLTLFTKLSVLGARLRGGSNEPRLRFPYRALATVPCIRKQTAWSRDVGLDDRAKMQRELPCARSRSRWSRDVGLDDSAEIQRELPCTRSGSRTREPVESYKQVSTSPSNNVAQSPRFPIESYKQGECF